MVFLTSLQSIIPIVLLILLGYILKGRGMFNPTFSGNLSRFIMSVALPAGVFVSVLHHLHTSDIWNLRYGMLVVGCPNICYRIYRSVYHDENVESS